MGPQDIPIIDTFIGFPSSDPAAVFDFLRPQLRDGDGWRMPAEYMFKDVPDGIEPGVDPVAVTLGEMDRFNIEQGVVSVHDDDGRRAVAERPDRFIPCLWGVDANTGMDAVRAIEEARRRYSIRCVGIFPAGLHPQVPIDDKRWYPVYAKCVELGLPVFVNVGVPGPRVPMACQNVERLDEVCWFFPELTLVMRHGAEPWTELAVKLMVKWPNLYYSTSAFAPTHYPTAIVDYANTRGTDRVLFAGYFPWGLTIERVIGELGGVAFRDHVWAPFLYENAHRVLALGERA